MVHVNAQVIEIYENDSTKPVASFTNSTLKKYKVVLREDTAVVDEHEYVDLGLPSGTLWATMNVGAEKPEDYGDYFAWAETTGYKSGKTNFDWETYKYCTIDSDTLVTKYCTDSRMGTKDGKLVLDAEDDAATANWGSNWRIPTKAEFLELNDSDYTTSTYTTRNDVKGYLITSNTNGNSIFIPAAGYYLGTVLSEVGYCVYWSSTLSSKKNTYAYRFYCRQNDIRSNICDRSRGRSVRPVFKK